MVKSYVDLVKSVEPFQQLFIEPGLLGESSSKDLIFDSSCI
jgi:hypothetical protein